MFRSSSLLHLFVLGYCVTVVAAHTFADCPCGAGTGPWLAQDAHWGHNHGVVAPGEWMPPQGMPQWSPGTAVNPPPGTVGRTYQLRSDPVPADKHPRAGMIIVRAPGALDVLVQDTNNFRTQDKLKGFQDADDPGVWHFETIMLLPGQPNIHKVMAIYPSEMGSRIEVRYVRFIMGRIVYLDIDPHPQP